MIAYLEGRLAAVTGNSCLLVTAGGVGYTVALPIHTLSALPASGEKLSLHTSLVVREDALELYGFESLEERQTFELLTTISKVGAKTALSVLSVFRPQDLRKIVIEDNGDLLTRVPGIGKKSAQHIFLELKDKLKALDGTVAAKSSQGVLGDLKRSVLEGLMGLGYTENEAYPVVQQVFLDKPECDVPEALRSALQALSASKSSGKN